MPWCFLLKSWHAIYGHAVLKASFEFTSCFVQDESFWEMRLHLESWNTWCMQVWFGLVIQALQDHEVPWARCARCGLSFTLPYLRNCEWWWDGTGIPRYGVPGPHDQSSHCSRQDSARPYRAWLCWSSRCEVPPSPAMAFHSGWRWQGFHVCGLNVLLASVYRVGVLAPVHRRHSLFSRDSAWYRTALLQHVVRTPVDDVI